ncbi:ATP-dependent Lon protease [Thermodesulfovibrio aggregans]|uniref:endopeptidase La n=1 Tax=Thermodesulfovibrio aggregans TaxID=86166 RepID=A0A0U9HU60_9BACT|nr:endopeptidase La [Thermodesulfovibrio aggregans]GAQ93871.1 ATP-dependent Lon protease [Thermodesulfovibrio aggregans]
MKFFRRNNQIDETQITIIEELRKKISQSGMPPHVQEIALKELDLFSKMNPSSAEYTITLTYIEYLVSLPWNKKTSDNLNLERAERILNERHYGLYEVKNRILEHLAVKILSSNKNPRILIVDDEEITRKNLEHVLKKENYDVVTAKNGVEALRLLDEQKFEIVLTDIKMEGVDGFAILEKVKAKYSNTKVIMITAYAAVDSAVEAIKRGAFHYIAKPFKIEEVKLSIKQAVEDRLSTISTKGSILCFAGPPGTGKTSIGKSIADALGRKFARISLGGIKDEAEIRGHRRTYAGAKPGRIIEEIRRTGVANPVLMLDEIDKICQDFKGDPASALLEALDPEQNYAFIDHYLDVPFDLSGVMFIVTANIPDNIQHALLDRMEIIEFSGYTEEEKKNIALKHLIPKQIAEQGLTEFPPEFTDEAILKIIQEYTREAGIRNLERMIATICRKIATEVVKGNKARNSVKITPEVVEFYLGPRRFYFEVADAKNRVGVVTGLVWTETGGDIIFVEAAKMKGKGELILTGSLGNIMKESAQAALSYVKSNSSMFGISEDTFENYDIHIHVPQGAIPKDGPSAGATIAMALISLFTNRLARRDVAITGELTLSGRILPVGGIKEKILAAKRAGVKTVIIPHRNRVDIDSLPENFKNGVEIIFMEKIGDIVDKILI